VAEEIAAVVAPEDEAAGLAAAAPGVAAVVAGEAVAVAVAGLEVMTSLRPSVAVVAVVVVAAGKTPAVARVAAIHRAVGVAAVFQEISTTIPLHLRKPTRLPSIQALLTQARRPRLCWVRVAMFEASTSPFVRCLL
jgi:hypothetical protein